MEGWFRGGPDAVSTTMTKPSNRTHAPTAASRASGWVGYACILAGIAVVALVLYAAGDGFEGWVIVGAIAAAVLIVVGVVMSALNLRRRRLRGSGGTPTHEPGLID